MQQVISSVVALILMVVLTGDSHSEAGRTMAATTDRPPTGVIAASTLLDCTLYASHDGDASAPGTLPAAPVPLEAARDRTVPGDVVCLLPGVYAVVTPFEITRSGTPDAWITYRSLNPSDPALIVPGAWSWDLIQIHATAYIELVGLHFDGYDLASNAVGCKGGHHLRVVGNTIRNMGQAGIATYRDAAGRGCDYVTADRNVIHRAGYHQGWSAGISYNSHYWSDAYPGFHSYITNNLISGTVDNSENHSDGNGIALDRGDDTPPVLVANNVVFSNGGRCIHTLHVQRAWIVNNTCYQNGLDRRVQGGEAGNNGEYVFFGSAGNVVINNIAYAWGTGRPFSDEAGVSAAYYRNISYTRGTGPNRVSAAVLNDPERLLWADPLFVDPPLVDEAADGQYAAALSPDGLGSRFFLQAGSPAIGAGINPRDVLEATPELRAELAVHLATDIEGRPRPEGGGWNLGAYEARP